MWKAQAYQALQDHLGLHARAYSLPTTGLGYYMHCISWSYLPVWGNLHEEEAMLTEYAAATIRILPRRRETSQRSSLMAASASGSGMPAAQKGVPTPTSPRAKACLSSALLIGPSCPSAFQCVTTKLIQGFVIKTQTNALTVDMLLHVQHDGVVQQHTIQ